MRKITANLINTHGVGVLLAVEQNELFCLIAISFFGAFAEVSQSRSCRDLIQEFFGHSEVP
jgi:hypothetical protein